MRKKIIVLQSDLLLYGGILNFLVSQDSYDVIGLEQSKPEQVFQEIKKIQPGIIISDQNNETHSFINLLSRLENIPHIRVILLNETDNSIQICDIRQAQIKQVSDFITALQ